MDVRPRVSVLRSPAEAGALWRADLPYKEFS
jgi:hypothetical protein